MNYQETVIGLYYLLIYADGHASEKELQFGKQMMTVEGWDVTQLEETIASYKTKDKKELYSECLAEFRKFDKLKQIRYISWLCVIANSDGFMDKEEWTLIYKIYNEELKLSLDEILKTQKEINKTLHGREFLTFGVKVK